ncbi:hypothetical protein D3C85_981630 [compost metagenome]
MGGLHGAGKTAQFDLPHPDAAQAAALFHLFPDAPRPALGRINEGEGVTRRVEQMTLAPLALTDEGRLLYLVFIECLGLFVIHIEPAITQLTQGITALFQLERNHKACSGGDWVRLLLWRGERLIQGITYRDDGNLLVLERTDSCRALAVGRVCTLGGLIGRTHASWSLLLNASASSAACSIRCEGVWGERWVISVLIRGSSSSSNQPVPRYPITLKNSSRSRSLSNPWA